MSALAIDRMFVRLATGSGAGCLLGRPYGFYGPTGRTATLVLAGCVPEETRIDREPVAISHGEMQASRRKIYCRDFRRV